MQQLNIADLFYQQAKANPGKTAIIDGSSSVTFARLKEDIECTAQYLIDQGIKKGDAVMIFVPMSIDLYRTVLAIFRIGAIAVFLDEWVSIRRLKACCTLVPCKAMIGNWKARVLGWLLSPIRKIPIHLSPIHPAIPGHHPYEATSPGDTALITFTTGSTGVPKAANRTHGFLKEQFIALEEKLRPHPGETDMPVLPIVLLINLATGNTSVIAPFKSSKPEKMKPGKIFELLVKHSVNRIISSPYFIKRLARYQEQHRIPVPDLHRIFTGGAPVFPSEAGSYLRALPDVDIEIVYGSTEAEPISGIKAQDLAKTDPCDGLDVGFPFYKARVKIINITDEPIQCDSEEELAVLETPGIGEIIVSGPHVLASYINNEAAIRRNKIFVRDVCWHRTGDSGYIKDGRLYLTGRCSTLIAYENEIIAPFTYEAILAELKGVEMGTVMRWEDRLLVVVEKDMNETEEAIRKSVKGIVVFPHSLLFIKKIPKDPRHHSKIDYERLKQIVSRKM
ncbi:MAG: AMP-binding protein [Taibaiella sp.]|nr:AMP-binding protein [Taibaiella sp.]